MVNLSDYLKRGESIDYSRFISTSKYEMLRDIALRLSILRKSTGPRTQNTSEELKRMIQRESQFQINREPYGTICIDNALLPILYVLNSSQINKDMNLPGSEGNNLESVVNRINEPSFKEEKISMDSESLQEVLSTPIYRVIYHCAGHKTEPNKTKDDFFYKNPRFNIDLDIDNFPNELGNTDFGQEGISVLQRFYRLLCSSEAPRCLELCPSHILDETELGYDLRQAGHRIVRTKVISKRSLLERLSGRINTVGYSTAKDGEHPISLFWEAVITTLNKFSEPSKKINPDLAVLITNLSEKSYINPQEQKSFSYYSGKSCALD